MAGVMTGLLQKPVWHCVFAMVGTAAQQPLTNKRGSSLVSTRSSHLEIAPRLAPDTLVMSGMTTMGPLALRRRQAMVATVQVANARVGNSFFEPLVTVIEILGILVMH